VPDVVTVKDGGIEFFHRNPEKGLFDWLVRYFELDPVKDQLWNPQKFRTSGGFFEGKGLKVDTDERKAQYAGIGCLAWRLVSEQPTSRASLRMTLHTAQTDTVDEWRTQLAAVVKASPADPKAEARRWWTAFWNRSRIVIKPQVAGNSSLNDSAAWQVGRNYQLFRFMLACNAYGALPTKFNGGNHMFDNCYVDFLAPRKFGHPDHRGWGGVNFVGQNQRLISWPMLKSGDSDMMPPQLDFYANMRRNGELFSKKYWGIEAACFFDQGNYFGLPCGALGDLRAKPISNDEELLKQLSLHANYFSSQLEYSWMMLEYARYSGHDISSYLPFIESTLKFYDQYYQFRCRQITGQPLDANGKLVIYPAKALETYADVKNPTDVLTGLTVILKRLLKLPESLAPKARKVAWRDLLNRLPAPAYYAEYGGRKVLLPGETYGKRTNGEIPQLYPVFPYRTFGVGRADLQVAVDSWRYGGPKLFNDRGWWSWFQNGIFTAAIGMTDEARRYTVAKLMDSGRRFPAFWGPGFDGTPDMNHGGSGMIGLQEMLLQEKDDDIYLLPAWPEDWPVEFKLHAPRSTIIEGSARNGTLEQLSVQMEGKGREGVRLHAKGIGSGRVISSDGAVVDFKAAGADTLEFPLRPGVRYLVEGLQVPKTEPLVERTLLSQRFDTLKLPLSAPSAKAKCWQRVASGPNPIIELPSVPGASGKAIKAAPQSVFSYDFGRAVRGVVRVRMYAQAAKSYGTIEIYNMDAKDTRYLQTMANLNKGKPTVFSRVYSGVMVGLNGNSAWEFFAQDKSANFTQQKLAWQPVGEGLPVTSGWVEITLDASADGYVIIMVKDLATGKAVRSQTKSVPLILAGGFRYIRLGCYSNSAPAAVWFDEVKVTEQKNLKK
jgi:hypothetical protein